MAEVVGLVSGLITVASLVGTAFRTSQALYEFAEQVQSASEDIEKFALDMRNFGFVIEIGCDCLKRFRSTCEPTSPLLRYFQNLKVIESLAEESKLTREGIRRARSKTCKGHTSDSTRSWSRKYNHIKWVFRKKHLDALHPSMERLKSNFALIMAYVNFEVAQKRGDSEETRQELISLKRQIRIQLDTIDLLQQSARKRREEAGETQGIYHFDPVTAGHEIQHKLSFLGTQIVEHDAIPDPEEYTPFSSRIFSNGHLNGAYANRTSVPHSQSSESPNTRSRQTKRSTSTATSYVSSLATTVESSEVRKRHGALPELRQARGTLPPEEEPENSASSRSSILSDNAPGSPRLIELTGGRTIAELEEGFISVRPKSEVLRLDPNRPLSSIQGYAHTDEAVVPITVILDKERDYNLISLADVQRLGLQMEPLDDEELVFFQTESGEKRSCGEVSIRWSEGLRYHKPFRVRCLVYGHEIRPFIFGRPFLERRRHYWGGHSGIEIEETVISNEEEIRKGKARES